ncbi:MAG: hypothetical protein P4L99_00120 [Chthoniobacter sp.]|nr:hypothetical protein [Chthoniobacter sp.]
MKPSIKRLFFFGMAALVGAATFGFFFSSQVYGRGSGGGTGPYCNPANPAVQPMCQNGQTVTPDLNTQSALLASNQATCGACATSPP